MAYHGMTLSVSCLQSVAIALVLGKHRDPGYRSRDDQIPGPLADCLSFCGTRFGIEIKGESRYENKKGGWFGGSRLNYGGVSMKETSTHVSMGEVT